ncbi:MAG TPA: transglycosylase domain-containing protein, partial [Bdellovibrio sp.]|nr:transglycosylase domain-containing protein [Bdellovibrio sp.]
MLKKIILFIAALGLIGVFGLYLTYQSVKSSLPQLITVKDYEPLLVSQVYDRNGKKIGEFFRERRTLVPYDKIPKDLVHAFLAAEDDQFFQHKGINLQSMFRAALANLRAGRSVQGGSTITQQVAKTLLLSSEKTLTRKLRDILLALEMEKNLKKEDILYLYLNQIYFGQGAYGVEQAAQTYYRKPVSQLTLPEMAILAGLPQAP